MNDRRSGEQRDPWGGGIVIEQRSEHRNWTQWKIRERIGKVDLDTNTKLVGFEASRVRFTDAGWKTIWWPGRWET